MELLLQFLNFVLRDLETLVELRRLVAVQHGLIGVVLVLLRIHKLLRKNHRMTTRLVRYKVLARGQKCRIALVLRNWADLAAVTLEAVSLQSVVQRGALDLF